MTTTDLRSRALRISALAGISLVALTGCSTAADLVNEVSTESFSNAVELDSAWDHSAPWLPAGATDITARWSTRDDTATLLVVSVEELDPAKCAETNRQSAPTLEIDGAPDAFSIDRVYACDDWTVAQTDNGWLGWTPNDPDEKAQSPAP